jgi:hypothetical protein
MKAVVRRVLAMAARVRDFFRKHPSDEPSHQEVLGKLEEALARGDAQALLERAGSESQSAAVARRRELRRKIRNELLPHLVRVGRVVAKERPDLAGRFRLPNANVPLRTFADMTKSMLGLALADRELFERKGLSRTLLDQLSEAFSGFEQATIASHEGRTGHVGARRRAPGDSPRAAGAGGSVGWTQQVPLPRGSGTYGRLVECS